MRILIVTGIFPPDMGGPASYVPRISDDLVTAGHHVEVVTLADGASPAQSRYPFIVTRIPRSLPLRRRFGAVVSALLARRWRTDVIYVNGLALEAFAANLLMRKPLVAKVVGDWAWERAVNRGMTSMSIDEFQQRTRSAALSCLKLLRSLPLRATHRVIVPSRYLQGLVSRWGIDPRRLRVIYNSFERVPVANPDAFRVGPNRAHLVTACRLVSWKGVDDLIRVVAGHPDWVLSVAGDGPERRRYEDLAQQLACAQRIRFYGNLPPSQVAALVSTGDAFVLNSSYEGLPHVILEAFALAVPVVANDAGGTGEVVRDGETGWLIPPRSPVALDAALQALLSADDRSRITGNATALLRRQFDRSVTFRETEEVLTVGWYD